MSNDLQKYAHTPLKQVTNRVWRTYQGGALIDRWKKTSPEIGSILISSGLFIGLAPYAVIGHPFRA